MVLLPDHLLPSSAAQSHCNDPPWTFFPRGPSQDPWGSDITKVCLCWKPQGTGLAQLGGQLSSLTLPNTVIQFSYSEGLETSDCPLEEGEGLVYLSESGQAWGVSSSLPAPASGLDLTTGSSQAYDLDTWLVGLHRQLRCFLYSNSPFFSLMFHL